MLRVRSIRHYFFLASLGWLALCGTASALAQEDISYRQGQFEVFYSVFNTSFISPEVAKAAGIVRAKNKGMLNISVIEHLSPDTESAKAHGSLTRPAEVDLVKAEIFDLLHKKMITFREIVEPSARYHLGTFKIANDNEFKQFRIKVLPKGSDEPIEFEFRRNLFID